MSNIRMFSTLNSIGYMQQSAVQGYSEEIQPTDVCKVKRAQIHTERLNNILTAQMKSKRMERQNE